MRFSAIAILALSAGTFAAAQSMTSWTYEGKNGALKWGKLDPSYAACSKGHAQSPIDIRGARLNTALQPIEFHYLGGPATLVNDGHTIAAHVGPGSFIMAGGVRYNLEQFQFHHPSEEAIGGKLTDMDVELLHRSADGKMAIVEIRLSEDRGYANAVMATLWPHLPLIAGKSEKVDENVNAGGFLPSDRGYWTYEGSLPMPPCTEGVRWFVLEQTMSISRDQWRRFAAIFPVNTRPLQDAHGRRIEANE